MGPEWTEFAVQKPKPGELRIGNGCATLDTVSHVAHIEAGCDVIRDGQLRAGLVFDESKLNKSRILVTWLSPNDWTNAGGSRYGNVEFVVPFRELIKGKSYYWVESIAYGIKACRILITDQDRSSLLARYDPVVGEGPWWYDEKKDIHFWNGEFTLEFMYEGSVGASDWKEVRFTKHHLKRCRIDPSSCPDRGKDYWPGGAEFVARSIGRGYGLEMFRRPSGSGEPAASFYLSGAFSHLVRELRKMAAGSGHITKTDAAAPHIARAILNGYGKDIEAVKTMVNMFASADDLETSCATIVSRAVGVAPGALSL